MASECTTSKHLSSISAKKRETRYQHVVTWQRHQILHSIASIHHGNQRFKNSQKSMSGPYWHFPFSICLTYLIYNKVSWHVWRCCNVAIYMYNHKLLQDIDTPLTCNTLRIKRLFCTSYACGKSRLTIYHITSYDILSGNLQGNDLWRALPVAEEEGFKSLNFTTKFSSYLPSELLWLTKVWKFCSGGSQKWERKWWDTDTTDSHFVACGVNEALSIMRFIAL